MNATRQPKHEMEAALKSLWGASAWPFAAAVKEPCETAAYTETLRRLEQCIGVHSSGVLHGPNGVGKSRLVQSLVERLPQKTYRTLVLHGDGPGRTQAAVLRTVGHPVPVQPDLGR